MSYYVYVLACKDGTFYTGYTRDLEARMKLHRRGRGAKYVRTHLPEEVVYLEEFETRSDAMKREREIKRMSHAEKMKLAGFKMREKI